MPTEDSDIDDIIDRRRKKRQAKQKRNLVLIIAGAGALAFLGIVAVCGLIVTSMGKLGGIAAQMSSAKEWDKESLSEINKAFDENPVAAQKKFVGQKYRMTGSVREISPPNEVAFKPDEYYRNCTVKMANGETEKLKMESQVTLEVCFESCVESTDGPHVGTYRFTFSNGRVAR